jgi:hypothetical protein
LQTWLHSQRIRAKAAGDAWHNEVYFGVLRNPGGGSPAGGTPNAERKPEPVLRIAVPTFGDYSSGSSSEDEVGGDEEKEDSEDDGGGNGSGGAEEGAPEHVGGDATPDGGSVQGRGDGSDSGSIFAGLDVDQVEAVARALGVSEADARTMLEQGIVRYEDVCG